MPCYEVRTVNVEFKAAHRDLLDKAIKALDWDTSVLGSQQVIVCPKGLWNVSIVLNLKTGLATVPDGSQRYLNELKRAYSAQAIKLAAKLNGWQVKNTAANKGLLVKGVL